MFLNYKFVFKLITVIILMCQTISVNAEAIELIDSLSHLIDYFKQHTDSITPDAIFGINFLKCIPILEKLYILNNIIFIFKHYY